jgi:hypothetical protein
MQPIGSSSSGSTLGKCVETTSKCVIWDGPDIKCLGVNLCKGQSIETVVYHTAKTLCEVLTALNISFVDLACLAPTVPGTGPTTPNQLFQLIIDKLCELNQDVIDLQNTGTAPITVPLPDCNALVANCPPGTTLQYTIPDPNNPLGPPITITSLVLIDPVTNTSPAVAYLAEVICELLCRMGNAEDDIATLQAEVQAIINSISGALPSVNVPACISAVSPMPIADPNDPSVGAVPAIANVLCDIITNITDDPTGGNYPMPTNCEGSDLSTLPVMGSYPGVVTTMADLGVIPNPQYLWQVVNNMMIAICDLRDFAQTVKSTCCPTLCAEITVDIGAVIPAGAPTTRDTVRFFLNGTFTDAITNSSVTSTFGFNDFLAFPPAPGYSVGGPTLVPPQWDIHFPVTITITDGALPQNTYTNTNFFLDDFAALNSYQDLSGLGLDVTTNYTLSYSVTVDAPDGTSCTFTDSIPLLTTCDNQPVNTLLITDVAYNGFTVSFNQPIVAGGTNLTGYTFTLTPTVGSTIIFNNVPPGYTTYYVYGDYSDYPNTPLPPTGGNDWYLTSLIQPYTQYSFSVIANYDCGNSNPVSYPGGFETLVAVQVEISNLTTGAECVVPSGTGSLTLSPTLLPGQIVSANFSDPIYYDGITPKFVNLSASPGVNFAYTFTTLAIKSGAWTAAPPAGPSNNCGTNTLTRCWGKHSAANYYPGNLSTTFTSLLNTYDAVGCYDYLTSAFSVTGGLAFTGAPLVTNINAGPGVANTNHGILPYTYNAPAGSGVVGTTNGTFRIINNAHALGNRPVVKIIIDDPLGYINNYLTMWYGISAAGAIGGATQSSAAVQHNPGVVNILNWAGISRPADKWFSTTGTNATPVGLPIFMRIAVYKWSGSGYIPPTLPTTTVDALNNCIDVTPFWIGLTDITTTGFNINLNTYPFNIGVRDRLVISFTGGVENDSSNPDYQPAFAPGIGAGTNIPSSVTIEQDPFAGIFPDPPTTTGPYSITGNSPRTLVDGISYTDATTGYIGSGLLTRYGVPLNTDSGALSGATATAYNQPCEFVISGDTTITWSVG